MSTMSLDRFTNPKYLDWVKVKLSLQYAKEGLEPTTDQKVQTFHDNLSSTPQAPSSSSASAAFTPCHSCLKTDLKRQWSRQRFSCLGGICDGWLDLLQQYHVDPTATVEWDNFDVSRLPTSPWEVAKLYLPYGSGRVNCAGDADLAAILTLYLNCRHFASSLQNVTVCDKVKEVRNRLLHSGTMEVESAQMLADIQAIKQLLGDPAFATDTACQEATSKIDKLVRDKLELSQNKELELAVLNGDIKSVIDKTDHLRTEVVTLKDKLDTEVSGLKDKLDTEIGGVNTEMTSLNNKLHVSMKDIVELQKVADLLCSFINACKIDKVDIGQLAASISTLSALRTETDRQGRILAQLQETVGRHEVTLEQHGGTLEQHGRTLEQHKRKLNILESALQAKRGRSDGQDREMVDLVETNKETEPRNAEGELFPSDIDEEGEEEEEEEEMMVINTSEDLFDSTASPASVLRGDPAKTTATVLKDDTNPKPISGRLSAKQCPTPVGVRHSFALNHQRGNPAKNNQATVLKDDTNPKPTTSVLKDIKAEAAVAKDDDDWSDDDLFDDSFIIKPTQLSVETKKSQVFGLKRKPFRDSDLPQSKCFRASERQAIGRFGQTAATSSASATVTTGSSRFLAAGIRPAVNSADGKPSTGLVSAHACTRTRQLQTKPVPTATVSSSVASGSVTRGSSVQTTGYKQQNGCVSVTEKPSSSFYGKNKVSTYTNSVSQSKPTSVMNASVMRSSSGYKNSPTYPTQTGLQSNNTYGATGSNQDVNQSTQNRVSAFKKHSSFSGTESVNQLRTSARKRSISGNSNSPTCSSTVVNSTVTKAGSFQAGSAQTANSSFQGQTKPSFSTYQKTSAAASKPHTVTSSSSSHIDGGNSSSTLRSSTRAPILSSGAFDTSLSDDLLCQLAEPDDIFDSQMEPTKRLDQPRSVASVVSSSYTKPSVFSKNTSSTSSVSVKTVKPEVPVAGSTAVKAEAFSFDSSASGNRTTAVASTGPASASNNWTIAVASTAGPTGAPGNRTTGVASTAGPAKQYRFRDSQKSRTSKSPPQPPKPAQTPAHTSTKAKVPVAAGPVQSVQSKNATGGKVVTKAEEDLLLAGLDDDAFDDEFSDDDCLTEPQILAMLDEAEFLATQHQTKYTAIDIERKKREALERKKLKSQLRNTQAS